MMTPNQSGFEMRGTSFLLMVALPLMSAPAAISLAIGGHRTIAVVIMSFIIGMTLLFSSLRIKLANQRLVVRMGGMLTVRNVALRDIASVRRTRPPRMAGLGIRWMSEGTLYTVTLGDAIEINMRDGSRFFVGSSTPDVWCEQIQEQLNKNAVGSSSVVAAQ